MSCRDGSGSGTRRRPRSNKLITMHAAPNYHRNSVDDVPVVRKPRTKRNITTLNPPPAAGILPSTAADDDGGNGTANSTLDLQWLSKPLSEYKIPYFPSPSPSPVDDDWLSKPLSEYQIPGPIPHDQLDSFYCSLSHIFNGIDHDDHPP